MSKVKKVVVGGSKPDAPSNEILTKFLKEEYPDVEVVVLEVCSDDEFIKAAKGAEVIMSQYQPMSDKIYEALTPDLRLHASLGIGFNRADVPSATKHNVIVTHVPDYCTDEVSSHTMAFILGLQRQLFKQVPYVKAGNWDINEVLTTKRLKGSTIGLYGLGEIARDVATKLKGFGVNVIAADPFVEQEAASEYDVKMVSFDELVEQSDILSLHAPLLKSTEGIFNKEIFKKMKPEAYLVNCARGELVVRDDLYEALTNNLIAGAAIDVVWNEPLPDEADKKIIAHPNVWATAHSAFYSQESIAELYKKAANEAGRALRSERPRKPVNKDVLDNIKWFKD